MPSEIIKKEIQNAYSNVSKRMDGFRNRYTQRLFIAEIVKTLCNPEQEKRIIVTEGPTGTGKTLAYLLASIPVAKALRKKLIISSATVALQTQLVERDLPLVQETSALFFKYDIAKGRGRYLCPSLLIQQLGDQSKQIDVFSNNEFLENAFRDLYQAFSTQDWNGDKDSWPTALSDEIWSRISNDRHGCLAARCDHFRECPYFTAKAKLEDTDVIVANHDLVLSDLALGGGILLSKPEDSIYVFDEAHHLPDKTVNHAVTWASTSGTNSWLDRSSNISKQIEAIIQEQDSANLFTQIDKANDNLKNSLTALINLLNSMPELSEKQHSEITYRFPRGIINESLKIQAGECLSCSQESYKLFSKLKDRLTRLLNDNEISPNQAEAVMPELGIMVSRLENLIGLWQNLVSEDPPDQPPIARWINRSEFKDHYDYRLFTSPISAAEFLQQSLWQRCYGAVLTSATLVSLGSFGYFQQKCGLQERLDTHYLQLASPYDFANNATLWIPWMKSEPQNAELHTQEIIDLLPELVQAERGTLVLFSSRKQLQDVAEKLPAEIREYLLVQGEYSIQVLLEKHKNAIESGESSVIMGLASFAEGIDLPGELCTNVIIAKLPFPVPDSPVEATEREYLEAMGKSHFQEIVLPQTCIKLIQAVGRLIRNESDTGKITILDRRLLTKSYGRQFLNALPPMRRIIEKSA